MALTTPRDSSDKYDDEDEDDHGQQQRESTVNEKLNVSCSCSVEVIERFLTGNAGMWRPFLNLPYSASC